MIGPSSRYAGIKSTTLVRADGCRVVYLQRRTVPKAQTIAAAGVVEVRAGQRLDTVAAATLGDPEAFWKICDASGALDPFDLAEPGTPLRIPAPGS